ncbi:outer membrane protein assembly factor BamA, partial [Polaribacter sp.]|nr:outer membrane protein assembly factor BamA [Polaribacter sp.]
MEKQANKLQNSISVVLVCTALFFTLIANSQTKTDSITQIKKDTLIQNVSFVEGKEYVLGGISVTGLKKFSEETVRVFTGLRPGLKIKLPGDKLTSAIKKLYESKQFSNVDVYLEKVDSTAVYLQFDVQELPQLNTVKVSGVKKSKAKTLIEEAELKIGAMVTDNLIVTTKNYFE